MAARAIRIGSVPVLALLALAHSASAQTLNVVSTSPASNASNVLPTTQIVVDFDRPVSPASLPPSTNHFHVFGKDSGPAPGTLALENGDQRLRFTPAKPFAAGEIVLVELADFVQATDGSFVQPGGWSWSFRVRAWPGTMAFQQIAVMTVRTIPSVSARVYGGAQIDLDDDGFADIVGVCEDSNDLRVFMNRAEGTGLYYPFSTPTTPVGSTPSPNDAADVDRDGKIDMVTCNTGGSSISVARGNGDGTFQPGVNYPAGNGPHGMALLDADGDGDLDAATANTSSDNVCLLLNNGNGTYAAPSFFEGGGFQEYALASADMDNDGLTDLVVGAKSSQRIIVHLSNGNGTFTASPFQNAGGAVWMIQCGDVNGDGKMDVSCANGGSGNGSVLLGNGNGTLGAPLVVPAGTHAVATDLGDLDGDGDLDWVLSCFGGGKWEVYRNNGAGVFSHHQTINAIANASCASPIDFDNDRDLDLVLFDEVGDWVHFMRNGNAPISPLCSPTLEGVVACPCSNPPSSAGRGCDNSAATGGALLAAAGTPSLAADTLVFTSSGETPTATSIVLQGNAYLPGGAVFGQGVRCVGGELRRLYLKVASGGSITAPQAGDPSVSAQSANLGVPILAGQHRYCMVYYRDPTVLGGCPPASTFNGTQALGVTWAP